MALSRPKTSARLRTSIKLFAMVQPDYVNDLVAQATGSSALGIAAGVGSILTSTVLSGNGKQYEVGAARNFSRSQTRTVYKRYSLGKNSHQPFQVVPQRIDTKLSIERIVLYNMDLLKRLFGFWGESLAMQQVPMMMVEFKEGPDGDVDKTAVIMYTNCWFTSNPIEYDIEAEDLLVVQDVEVECGSVIVLDTSAGGIVSAVNTVAGAVPIVGGAIENVVTIAKNIKL